MPNASNLTIDLAKYSVIPSALTTMVTEIAYHDLFGFAADGGISAPSIIAGSAVAVIGGRRLMKQRIPEIRRAFESSLLEKKEGLKSFRPNIRPTKELVGLLAFAGMCAAGTLAKKTQSLPPSSDLPNYEVAARTYEKENGQRLLRWGATGAAMFTAPLFYLGNPREEEGHPENIEFITIE